jgi:hypothetical protein
MRRHWLEYASTAAVLVISLLSLWVAIGSEDANKKMVEASSWPFLEINSGNGDSQGNAVLNFTVSNSGVGPAKVKSFEALWKGKPYRNSLDLMRACCGYPLASVYLGKSIGAVSPWATSTTRMAHRVIRAGDDARFLRFPLTEQNAAAWQRLDHARQNSQISFRICYCSVFDECWTDTFSFAGDVGPSRVDVCPVPKVSYDQ